MPGLRLRGLDGIGRCLESRTLERKGRIVFSDESASDLASGMRQDDARRVGVPGGIGATERLEARPGRIVLASEPSRSFIDVAHVEVGPKIAIEQFVMVPR